MTNCSYCKKNITSLPFKCHRCTRKYCSKHRLPEDHNCSGIVKKDFFKPLIRQNHSRHRKNRKEKKYNRYEMYNPKKKKHPFKFEHFNLSRFLKKYVYFRVDHKVKPHLYQFLMLFVIGIILDYVYYGNFSLYYLFIGGIKDLFNVLISTLNGVSAGYDFFYLIINGIFYFFFYMYFAGFVFTTLTRLHKRDTWVMMVWFLVLIYLAYRYIPNLT